MRTPGCRNLTKQEKDKIEKDLNNGLEYGQLKSKYGLKSDSAIRKIVKERNIPYQDIQTKKKTKGKENIANEQIDLFSNYESGRDVIKKIKHHSYEVKMSLDDLGILALEQGKETIYLTNVDVLNIFAIYLEKCDMLLKREIGNKIINLDIWN